VLDERNRIMKIGIIGAGNVATGLAKFWAKNGHQLFLSYSRDAEKLKRTAASIDRKVQTGTAAQAAAFGEVVVLAFPFTALDDAMKSTGTLSGKLVFSCVNALKGDNSGLAVGTTTSAAEEIAKCAPGARVVEGLPAFAELLHSDSRLVSGMKPSVFVCGDDAEGKQIVKKLLEESESEVIDAGPLWAARYIEPAMMLLVNLAYAQGYGSRVGYKFLHDVADPQRSKGSV
jgi:predicted dinucleotide-binding enzyme